MATTAESNAFIGASTAPDTGSRRGPRKRTLTETRREQNRLNQRTYRQKQRKQRLQGLQHRSQSSPAQNLELRPRPTNRRPDNTTTTREASLALRNTLQISSIQPEQVQEERTTTSAQGDVASPQDQLPWPLLDFSCTMQASFQPIIDLGSINEPLSAQPSTSRPPFSSFDSSMTSIPSDLELLYPGPHGDLAPNGFSTSNRTITVPDQHESPPRALEFLAPEDSSAAARDWSPPHDLSPSSLTLLSDIATELRSDDYLSHKNVQDETITIGGFGLERIIAAGVEVLLCGRQPATTFQSISSPSRLPDPGRNCIQFSQTKILQACFQNAQSMGFHVQDVIMPQCIQTSPFYRPLTPADDPKKLLAAVTNPSTPAHLKPTLPQLLYPHPAFMDLIPIPAFRARAITLSATQPHLINIRELKKDMTVENGLSYWSSDASSGADRGGQGQPWDMRSWEAAPWFLRKWRMLVGGEEGEVWRQSLWWQRARGEVVSNCLT